MQISLRPVAPGDEPLLLAVYAGTRREEMAMVPWAESQKQAFLQMQFMAQLSHYQTHFPQATHLIILHGERPVGRLYANRADQVIRVLDLAVLPDDPAGADAALAIMQALLAEAAGQGQVVQAYVESFNPELPRYEQLGFARVAEHGLHYLMEWSSHA